MRNNMAGYPYSQSRPPVMSQTMPQQQQQQLQQGHPYGTASPTHPGYPVAESDANYYRRMLGELGYGESTEGGAYSAVNGFALTMPGNSSFGLGSSPPGPHSGGMTGYADPNAGHAPTHGGYTQQTSHSGNRQHHYQPYPPPSYNGGHPGYGGIVAR